MTGTAQKTSSGKFPLYKICCLIPQEADQNETVYLSSTSEVDRFLQEHGIGERRYRAEYGSNSIATCTEELCNAPQVISNIKEQSKKQNDQINSNLSSSCHINEVVTWHRCNKNESLVHFCKKSNSSLYHNENKYNTGNNKNECSNIKKKINDAHKTPITDENYNKLISKNIKSKLKKNSKIMASFRSEILINAFRRQKKKSNKLDLKMNQNVSIAENNMNDLLDASDDLNNNGIPLLAGTVLCETAMHLEDDAVHPEEVNQVIAYGITEVNGSNQQDVVKAVHNALVTKAEEVHQEDVKKVIAYDLEVNASQQPVLISESLSSGIKLNDTNDTQTEWLDTMSEESIASNFQCSDKSKDYSDQTFYDPPTKFLEEMSDWVMKYFIDKESDASWLKAQNDKKISKKLLGIDKNLSELHILKKIAKHHPLDCLLSHLTPRQKRLLASGIFKSLEEFNITGRRWGGLAHEILKRVCKTFKSQRVFVI